MTQYGKIHSYDTAKGAGMIKPEKGGDALPFQKADLQQQAEVPKADQRYGYDTKQDNGGKAHAINLQMEQGDSDSDSGSKQQS
jgi:cold shock protein